MNPDNNPILQKLYANDTHIGVVGAGVMGQTLLSALLTRLEIPRQSVWAACKTTRTSMLVSDSFPVPVVTDIAQAPVSQTSVVLLCVKPAQAEKVVKQLADAGLPDDTLIISIAAGKTIATLAQHVADSVPIIRAMPNTPAVVGRGMTVISPGHQTTDAHVALAQALFDSVGECIQLGEQHFDAVTGLCGSGPAYMYLMMEALADGGVRVGLPRDLAMQIVTQTVLGAASMVKASGRHPAALRDDVTTPAGCTIAGLLTLEDGKIRSVLARAVEEATNVAKTLG